MAYYRSPFERLRALDRDLARSSVTPSQRVIIDRADDLNWATTAASAGVLTIGALGAVAVIAQSVISGSAPVPAPLALAPATQVSVAATSSHAPPVAEVLSPGEHLVKRTPGVAAPAGSREITDLRRDQGSDHDLTRDSEGHSRDRRTDPEEHWPDSYPRRPLPSTDPDPDPDRDFDATDNSTPADQAARRWPGHDRRRDTGNHGSPNTVATPVPEPAEPPTAKDDIPSDPPASTPWPGTGRDTGTTDDSTPADPSAGPALAMTAPRFPSTAADSPTGSPRRPWLPGGWTAPRSWGSRTEPSGADRAPTTTDSMPSPTRTGPSDSGSPRSGVTFGWVERDPTGPSGRDDRSASDGAARFPVPGDDHRTKPWASGGGLQHGGWGLEHRGRGFEHGGWGGHDVAGRPGGR